MPYTTPSEVKKRALVKWDTLNTSAGVPFATEADFDSWLTSPIIPETEKLINEYCRRPDFSSHLNEAEIFDGDGFRRFVVLSNKPVTAVSKLDFKKGDGTWDLKDAADWRLKGDQVLYKSVLPRGFQNVRVTYDWGFTSVPADVSNAAAEIVARFLQKRVVYKAGPLVRVGDFRVVLADPEVFTDDVKANLWHYRRDYAVLA